MCVLEREWQGGFVCVCVFLCLSIWAASHTASQQLDRGRQQQGTWTSDQKQSPGWLCISAFPLHVPLPPTLPCKSKLHAAQSAAPQSASGTSGGRKSNLFDWDIICIVYTVAITTMIKTIIPNPLLRKASSAETTLLLWLAADNFSQAWREKKYPLEMYLCIPWDCIIHFAMCLTIQHSVTGQQLCVYSVVMKSTESTQGPALCLSTPCAVTPICT